MESAEIMIKQIVKQWAILILAGLL